MSPSFHNPPFFFLAKPLSALRSLPLGSGTHFMPAAISMLSAKFLNISQSWKPWTFEISWTDFNIFLLSFGPKSLRCSHATASLAVSPVSQHHGIHHCPDRPPLLFNRPGAGDVGPTKVWGTNCAALSGFKNLDVPWCQEPLAEIELCRHFKSLWSQKKWKSPRTIEIKFRDVYCNRIISITSQVFAGVVLIAPKIQWIVIHFSPIEMATLWAIYIIYIIYPHFQRYPNQFNPKSWWLKPNYCFFAANETLDTFGASSSCRSWNCDLGEDSQVGPCHFRKELV